MNVIVADSLEITPSQTKSLKGIAVLLLLCHHLFYIQNGLSSDVFITFGNISIGIVNQIGLWAKYCVNLFVFLSGYGLTKKYQAKEFRVWDFYSHVVKRLLLNYWFIWIIFVPIDVLVFGRTFSAAYGNHWQIKLVLDLLGILNFTGTLPYNPTWWFYSCIISLYMVYPLIRKRKVSTYLTILGFSLILSLGFVCGHFPFIAPFGMYIGTFVLGIMFARYDIFTKTKECFAIITILMFFLGGDFNVGFA